MNTNLPHAAAITKKAVYSQIEDSLRDNIQKGRWPTGAMLPSRRDLAKEYGVSPITVERAISRLIADGILRADDRRGTFVMQPEKSSNGTAPYLTSSSEAKPPVATATIGIIAALYVMNHDHLELHNFWVRLLVQSLEHAFSHDGKTTQFFNRVQGLGEPLVPLEQAVQEALSSGVEAIAIIAIPMETADVDRRLAQVSLHQTPTVCISMGELQRPLAHVFYDNRSAGYQAAQHLILGGSRDILFLAPFMAPWVKERLEGVQSAVEHAGLPAETVRIYPRRCGPWVIEEDPQIIGYAAAQAAFAEGMMPSSVICANDGVALGYLQAASELSKKAGRDFTIIGFDDNPESRTMGLTTLRPPMEAMGQEAARLLLKSLHGESANMQVRLRWHLLPRASTRKARNHHP